MNAQNDEERRNARMILKQTTQIAIHSASCLGDCRRTLFGYRMHLKG